MTSAYTINLNPNITTPVKTGYTFKSGDKGITFNLVVAEMDPTGTSAKIAFHRANGTSVEAALSGQGPTYSYTILGNEFAVPGVVVADVKFYQSTTQRVSTASFVFNVINDTLDGLGGGTAGYSDELETLRAEMEEAAEVLDDYIDAYGELKPLNPRGNYSSTATYHPCDLVYYNGSSWVNTAESTGQAPASGSAYWMKGVDVDASKADKVVGATAGHFAGLDASGNLTDSGESPASLAGWVTRGLATTIGSASMRSNDLLKLAFVEFNAKAGSGSGTINLPEGMIITSSGMQDLRGNGYLTTIPNESEIHITDATAWGVGQIIFTYA